MAAYDLVVDSTTYALPTPSEYSFALWFRGAQHRMANGSLVTEGTSLSARRRFTVGWTNITEYWRGVVDTAANDLIDCSSASWTGPDGVTYSVVLGERGLPDWTLVGAKGNTERRYSGELTLEQA